MGLAGLRAQHHLGRLPYGQPGGTALVNACSDPQAGRIDQPQHRLPRHHGGARLGLAGGDHTRRRGQQAHIAALLHQCGPLGGQTLHLLARARRIGLGTVQCGAGRGQLLLAAFECAGADEGLAGQVFVAAQVARAQLLAGQRILHLGLGGGLGAACAGQRGIQRRHALVQIDRVHLGQQLAGLHAVAHIGQHAQHAACRSGADHPAAPRLHRADAKGRRADRARAHLRHRHPDRGQRAVAHQHKCHATQHGQAQTGQRQAAAPRCFGCHGCFNSKKLNTIGLLFQTALDFKLSIHTPETGQLRRIRACSPAVVVLLPHRLVAHRFGKGGHLAALGLGGVGRGG